MLFRPEQEVQQLNQRVEAVSKSGDVEELRRLTQVYPSYGAVWGMLGCRTKDLQEGVRALWKAVWLEPCIARNYLALAQMLTDLDESDPLAKQLRWLALWKLSYQEKVPKSIGKSFERELGKGAWEPETYALLAKAQESAMQAAPETEAIAAQMRPHRLFSELQRDALDGMKASTLKEILQHREECEPLLRNALREWAISGDALDQASTAMVIAILGEISGPDFADELLELIDWDDETIFWHVQWALWRQGQRHPHAVMERYRQAANGPLAMRCGIVEQILVMEPIEGDSELLESLLMGYESFAENRDAPHLLNGVAGALVARGKSNLAHTLAKRYGSNLNGLDQELQAALQGSPIRMLAEEEIPELSIEDVCLNTILMGDAESDSEDFNDDELEDPIDLAPPPRPGRNEPCWCGSGKKYKKCHLLADEESDRKQAERPRQGASVPDSLIRRVIDAAFDWHKPAELRRAKSLYFGEEPQVEIDDEATGGFIEWMIYDFRDKATNRTAIEYFLHTRESKLSPAEREVLESMREARYGLYEVERVVPGSGVDLHDLFAGDRMFVHDISSSHVLHRWDCLLTRAQHSQGRWIFGGNGINVPRTLLDDIRGFILEQSTAAKLKPADYVRANSHNLHRVVREAFAKNLRGLRVVNNEGEAVTFGTSEYAVSEEQALVAKLESLEELEAAKPAESGARRFVWLQPMGKDRRPLGSLEIANGTLKAEAMSRTRLETLRGLVEYHGGALVTHRADHYTSVEDIKDRVIRGEKAPPPKPASDEERAVIRQFLEQHYANWPDERLPALEGKSAREAVRTKAGRQAVTDLLRGMENREGRDPDSGGPSYDFNIIRRELGLPEE